MQTKIERKLKREADLTALSGRAEAINDIVKEAEPFVRYYYQILRNSWKYKMSYAGPTIHLAEFLNKPELKELNKKYKLLLKTK